MLVLALAVAAGFAALSQWQLARSVATGTVVVRTTETPVPLDSIAQPQHPVTTASDGQLVTVSGTWAPQDYLLVSDRLNNGASGYWVVGHLSTSDSVGVAVALGWTDSRGAGGIGARQAERRRERHQRRDHRPLPRQRRPAGQQVRAGQAQHPLRGRHGQPVAHRRRQGRLRRIHRRSGCRRRAGHRSTRPRRPPRSS